MAKEMNGYLVLVVHSMDDFPVFLTEDYEEAIKFAKKQRRVPANNILDVLGRDGGCTPIGVEIITFRDGQPAQTERAKEWD